MAGANAFLVLKILSSHMKKFSEHINSNDQIIHYFDHMNKTISDLDNNKCIINDYSSSKLTDIHN